MSEAEKFAPLVPAAVKAAAARASDLQNKFINPDSQENPPDDDNQPPEDEVEAVSEDENQPPAPPVEPPKQPDVDDNDDSWKHKFLSMQGRYNSESKQFKDQIGLMRQEITNLNRLLATVQTEAAPPPPPAKKLVTPEELAEYGPELVDLMSRVAKEATAPYEQEITNLKGQLKQVGGLIAGNAREVMMNALEESVPNWSEINTSDDFIAWLALPDPYSGVIRHEMLNAAFGRNDTRRVVNFFKGFLAETAATAPADEEPGKPAVPGNKTSLKTLAAPGRAKSTAAPSKAPVEKPILTTAQITAFYTDKANGKYRGREDAAKKLEADIFAAQSEGRIR